MWCFEIWLFLSNYSIGLRVQFLWTLSDLVQLLWCGCSTGLRNWDHPLTFTQHAWWEAQRIHTGEEWETEASFLHSEQQFGSSTRWWCRDLLCWQRMLLDGFHRLLGSGSWSIVLSRRWLHRQILARSTPRTCYMCVRRLLPHHVQPLICLVPQPPSCFRFLLTKPLGGPGWGDSHAIRKVGKPVSFYNVYYLLIK